ncbi:MAG TPA: hypothetical protein VGX76_01700, partial [Pirellulales bacterium]|nr:hypothetical protein [Pirellulales bacterium]
LLALRLAVVTGSSHHAGLVVGLLGACWAVLGSGPSELRAVEQHSLQMTISAPDDSADAVLASSVATAQGEARIQSSASGRRPAAELTLRALGEAVRTKRRPNGGEPPADAAKSHVQPASAARDRDDQPEEDRAVRRSEPAPLPDEPPGWVAAGTRTNKRRTANLQSAPAETVKPRVRWADARTDEHKSVRPVANWSPSATVRLRERAGQFNPLRDTDAAAQETSPRPYGANPLRSR